MNNVSPTVLNKCQHPASSASVNYAPTEGKAATPVGNASVTNVMM